MTARREYRSRLRAERAEDTRERIITAARELFAARGLEATTMSAIAARAGVADPTVYAVFGSKREIMAALLARTEQAAHAPQWAGQIAAEADPAARLALFAAWSRELFESSDDLVTAVHRGPAVAELAAEGEGRRRQAVESLIAGLAEAGGLRPGLTRKQAADRVWMLTGPETYLLAAACGWPPLAYQQWLAETLAVQILRASIG
ncbi:MAG TPA: helix-turn-helix domain-containing protein [Streptosporangiaceae bacterium]|jgi:AcrR family transcriptional regulator